MKKYLRLLVFVPVLFLLSCNQPAKPTVKVQIGSLDATITVPDGCGQPCNSVVSTFTLGEEVDELAGMNCTTDFGDGTQNAIQPMRQATHTYTAPGTYTMKFQCKLTNGTGGSWFQGGEQVITVPLQSVITESEVEATETPEIPETAEAPNGP